MKLESQVVSLEHARKLKELGVRQESAFYWIGSDLLSSPEAHDTLGRLTWPKKEAWISAFTVAELGEMLPDTVVLSNGKTHVLVTGKTVGLWEVGYRNGSAPLFFRHTSEADARAKCLVYLIENKIISVEEVNERISDAA